MINFSSNTENKHKLTKTDVVSSGMAGIVSGGGVFLGASLVSKVYSNAFLNNQPVMFSEETKFFKELHGYIETLSKSNPNNASLASLLAKANSAGSDKEDLINCAYSIFNSEMVQNARSYSDGFFRLGQMAQSEAVKDETLIINAKNLLNSKINPEEKRILTEFVQNPSLRKELLCGQKMIQLLVYKKICNLSSAVMLHPDLSKLAKQMFRETGLSEKGVSYYFGTPEFYEQLKQRTIEKCKLDLQKALAAINKSDSCKIVKKIKKLLCVVKKKSEISKVSKSRDSLIKGTNAFYSPLAKKAYMPILTPLKEVVFHELGHAVNSNFIINNVDKVIKFLNHKLPKYAIPAFLTSSLFMKKDIPDEKRGFIRKTREFIKNNIMTMCLVISAPKLLEEAVASVRGIKFLKGKVTPQQFKNAIKASSMAWSTYFLGAASIALSAKFAVWVGDKIQIAKQVTEK